MSETEMSKEQQNASMFQHFLHSQVGSSLILVFAALLALAWANSQWGDLYQHIAHLPIGLHVGEVIYQHSLAHWIKDGLMVIFFFVVGLEIKREMVVGELSTVRRAVLPVTAAVGGAVIPALLYLMLVGDGPEVKGWGVPMATDIAFALGLLALFGKRVPLGLKVFLMALAIVDDMLAVLVIALFYTNQIDLLMLFLSGFAIVLIAAASHFKIRSMWVYLPLFVLAWATMEASGVHATVAGVLVALAVPVRSMINPQQYLKSSRRNLEMLANSNITQESLNKHPEQRHVVRELLYMSEKMMPPGIWLESHLHGLQAFIILPLFALFSAGVVVEASTLENFPSDISLAIIVGLVVGKQIGILSACWLTTHLGYAELPDKVNWGMMWGASALAGIGFTMSIFISELAFVDEGLLADAKIGVMVASLIAGTIGYIILNKFLPKKRRASRR